MIRYLAVYGTDNFEKDLKKTINDIILYVDKEPPETPYVKIKIEVVKKEKRYEKAPSVRTRSIQLFGKKFILSTETEKRE